MKTEAPTSEAPENKEWEQFCGSYFKAGDFRYRLSVIPGEAEERDNLSITVYKRSMEGAPTRSQGLRSINFHMRRELIPIIWKMRCPEAGEISVCLA